MTEQVNEKSGFNTPAVVLGGLAVLLLALALSMFFEGGYLAAERQEEQVKIYTGGISEQRKVNLAEQQDLLHESARYLDPEKGVLCMPIEDAMKRVVAKNSR